MSYQTIIDCTLILIGALILLFSIINSKKLIKTLPFIPKHHRRHVKLYLLLHRGLMTCFLLGYLTVLVAFALGFPLLSEPFVSVIFLFGAVYVFSGITIQSRLLSEVQNTLQGILPICAKCKKVKSVDGESRDQKDWKEIEEYISQKTDVGFSHGYCPNCFNEQLVNIEQYRKRLENRKNNPAIAGNESGRDAKA